MSAPVTFPPLAVNPIAPTTRIATTKTVGRAADRAGQTSGPEIVDAMVTEADVRRLALALPETAERPSYGTPAFRVKDKPFARIHQDGGILVLWCAHELEKESLIESGPEIFFSMPHYDGYPLVLVRMDAVGLAELEALLADAWYVRASKRLRAVFDAGRPD